MLGAQLAAIPDPVTSRRPGIPPLLAHVVMKCLEKRPADRPQTASDLMATLDMLTTPRMMVAFPTTAEGMKWSPWTAMPGFSDAAEPPRWSASSPSPKMKS
jgi:hypothetical protein